MEETRQHVPEGQPRATDAPADENRVIPVVQEQVTIGKRLVETGKVHISKKVTEDQTTISIPLVREEYDVERTPVNQVVDTPPPAMRYEGETAIIPVLREVLVVQKKFEVIEEIRITKRRTEHTDTQQISLRKEEVHINRSGNDASRVPAQ
jgi:uncharacterized protein (TIGR02271 family)